MARKEQEDGELRPAGYARLIDRYELEVISNWHVSYVTGRATRRITETRGKIQEIFPSSYWPGEGPGDHLEFALKYDGTNLGILACLFETIELELFLDYVHSKPQGKYVRRLWFLYEFLTGRTLPIEDLKTGNYVSLLDTNQYFTLRPGRRITRQRIDNNLLGDSRFCPTVRRTKALQDYVDARLADRSREVVSSYSPDLLKRALSYFYLKETKSSFEIENIKPGSTRIERFTALLHSADREDFCSKTKLVEAHDQIVDERFREFDYRTTQNYVGESISWQQERVYFVAPRPKDLPELMEGLIDANTQMTEGDLQPVIQSAAIAYGFVFLHPFMDGNGRIHRFLIHNILATRGFTPEGMLFPVSAAMLQHIADYDKSLEAFSLPLMSLVEYDLDEVGHMTVLNDTAHFYKYIDVTHQAEALFGFIKNTIDEELTVELEFLKNYDKAKEAISEIVDMPDKLASLFIRLCLQNNGRLSATKRDEHFERLSDEEISLMEKAVQASYGIDTRV
ncbi:MAG: Fic family protein [Actinobacteria bacterium]|nr:Fic family protein [Actinomycetota bacterium]MBU1945048.1 Fic family protein [Actinomycetota bacterium]MBU2686616.1 Fic family protein [Actinomycetota bacterium]